MFLREKDREVATVAASSFVVALSVNSPSYMSLQSPRGKTWPLSPCISFSSIYILFIVVFLSFFSKPSINEFNISESYPPPSITMAFFFKLASFSPPYRIQNIVHFW